MEPTTTRLSRPDLMGRRAFSAPSRRGFTLAELLVVIGIMLVLMAILLPMLSKIRANAQRVSIASDLVGIAQALDQYKHDWGDYPRTTTDIPTTVSGSAASGPSSGGVVLCWALIAPGPASQDGAGQKVAAGGTDMGAPGFRPSGVYNNASLGTQYQGKVYGPYLNVERYRYGVLANPTSSSPQLNLAAPSTQVDDTNTYIADSQGNAILYFPAITNVVPGQGSPPATLVGLDKIGQPLNLQSPHHVYNYNDNVPPLLTSITAPFPPMCSLTPNILNLQLGANTPQQVITPFLLISAGHDGRFGPSLNAGAAAGDDDDVAYPDVLAPVPPGTTP